MTKIFSLKGKGLKFDTAADIETYLRDLAAIPDVEAIDISGNTWGIDAVKSLAEVLKRCRSIKVCPTH
jgi:Ran GTPase-activating protein 1